MDLATIVATCQAAMGTYNGNRLTLAPRVQRFVDRDRIIATGSALSKGWRSYLIAPSKFDRIIRRAVRVNLRDKGFTEEQADCVMMLTMFETGMTLDLSVKDQQLRLPEELARGLRRGTVWYLPFPDYVVVTTNRTEVDRYTLDQKKRAAAPRKSNGLT